jgi:TonB-linked SusC/RagA family outer membrane protein
MKNNLEKNGDVLLKQIKKISRIMKMTFLMLLLIMTGVCAIETHSQVAKVSITLESAPCQEVLSAIELQTDYLFVYEKSEIDLNKRVTVNARNQTVVEVLNTIFQQTDVVYAMEGNNIMLMKKSENGLIRLPERGQQQDGRRITGTVTDAAGEPVIGANILEKGVTNGTVTDVDGKFTLAVGNNATIVVSYIGYNSQEIAVGNRTNLQINLAETLHGLDEVVVIGYGAQKKVNLTGAVATVRGEDIIKRPVTNVSSMIQGFLPGVQVVQSSGEPGNEGVNIRIRGLGSFGAGSSPLVLIDGVQGSLSDLNPRDVENISVLKDAASASIYGSRAANGVILVTTKTGGEEGKITMEYDGNFGVHTPTKLFDLITNSAEYMELWNEARINSGYTSGLYAQEDINAYRNATDRNLYPNCNWIDLMFNPAFTHTHNLGFSGSSNRTRFNVSLGYANQDGVMKGFNYEKYNLRLSLTTKVNDKIQFGGNVAIRRGVKIEPKQGAGDTFLSTMAQAPTYSPYLSDGSGRGSFKAFAHELNNKNIIVSIDEGTLRNTESYAIQTQGWLEVELLKGLKWYTKGAFNLDISKYNEYGPTVQLYNFRTNDPMSVLDVGKTGLTVYDSHNVYKNLYSYLAYDNTFGSGHAINAQVGYSVEDNIWEYLSGYRQEFPANILRELDAGNASVQNANGNKTEWALMSWFGRLGYNFKERYLIEANLRYDASSRLSPESRWGAFPSYSAAWRISEEQFIKDLDLTWLDNLKIRGSYGKLGNQNIGDYPYQAMLALTGSYSFDDAALLTGVAQTALANTRIKWETTSIFDVGFDFMALQGLDITFDWYKKTTTDILRGSQVNALVGLSAPVVNNGTLENTGYDVGIRYSNQVKSGVFKGLYYNAGLNFDHYKNKTIDFGTREISGYNLREEGQPWETFYMLEWIGIFQSPEEIANSPKQYNDATVPGDLKFKDQDGDGDVDDNDRITIDGKYPMLNYSLNFNLGWKGFDLSAQVQGVDNVKYYVTGWGTIPFNQGAPPTTDWRNRWTEDNPSTTMPRIYFSSNSPRLGRNSTWFLQDGSYLRVKNLTFGYTLPASLTQKAGISNLRIYFSGDNLLTFTNYPELDPERSGSGNFVNYPQNKIYSLGLNVKF